MDETSVAEAFSKLKPDIVVFVVSVDENKKPNGLVASRFIKCSRNPPMLAVSLGNKSNTSRLIRESKEFVVAVANKDLLKHIETFGRKGGKDLDKFSESRIETMSAKQIQAPLLKDASINFECKLKKEIDLGSDTLFLGEIVTAHINEDKKVLFNYGKGYGGYSFKEL